MINSYKNYWRRKQLIDAQAPTFKVLPYWNCPDLNPCEEKIFGVVATSQSILDYGAGTLRIQKKFQSFGYNGSYKTLDISDRYNYDFSDLSQVKESFDTILFLDVLEHLPLEEGLSLLNDLLEKLNPGGHLVLQTPNGRSLRNQKATDMTHLHIYNLKDLWAYGVAMGFDVRGWRVAFRRQKEGLMEKLVRTLSWGLTTKFLGCDYADNILLIFQKK